MINFKRPAYKPGDKLVVDHVSKHLESFMTKEYKPGRKFFIRLSLRNGNQNRSRIRKI